MEFSSRLVGTQSTDLLWVPMVPPGRIELPTSALPSNFNDLREYSHVVLSIVFHGVLSSGTLHDVPTVSRQLLPVAYHWLTDDRGSAPWPTGARAGASSVGGA